MAETVFKSLRDTADLRHLRQIIIGLDEGVILIDPDQSLLWAGTSETPSRVCTIGWIVLSALYSSGSTATARRYSPPF